MNPTYYVDQVNLAYFKSVSRALIFFEWVSFDTFLED